MSAEMEPQEEYTEVIEENPENALSDYEDAKATSAGKYRCRDCGKLFETLEEHDLHRRQVHGGAETIMLAGISM